MDCSNLQSVTTSSAVTACLLVLISVPKMGVKVPYLSFVLCGTRIKVSCCDLEWKLESCKALGLALGTADLVQLELHLVLASNLQNVA